MSRNRNRREFKRSVKVAIIKRATKELPSGFRYAACEKCGMDCRGRFVIDHIDPDALQIDKSKPLTAEEGQLLCLPCNEIKTKKDIADIAKVKRQEAEYLGADKPNKSPIPRRPKAPRQTDKLDSIRALGSPSLSRQVMEKYAGVSDD